MIYQKMDAAAASGIVTYGGVESGGFLLLPTDSAVCKSSTSTAQRLRDRSHIERHMSFRNLELSYMHPIHVQDCRGAEWLGTRAYVHSCSE